MPAKDIRLADLAITSNRMLIAVLYLIWTRRYRTMVPHSLGASLELMLVSLQVSVATRDQKPPTVADLSKKLHMPRSTALRHLNTLVRHGVIRRNRQRYAADLDALDGFMMDAEWVDLEIATIEAALSDLKRLRALLHARIK